MSFSKLQVANFGKSKGFATGSNGAGYIVLDVSGSIIISRTTGSVYELSPGSGNYAAYVSYPDDFHGSILWDTGTAFSGTFYAGEEFNYEANNPRVDASNSILQSITGSLQLMVDMTAGRWKIVADQMIFYSLADDTIPVATFDLTDDTGLPSMDAVFERRKP